MSFIFVDGEFSHSLIKSAADGDYRIQSSYGGSERVHRANFADLTAASAILSSLDETPLYARVDMARNNKGHAADEIRADRTLSLSAPGSRPRAPSSGRA